MKRIAGAAILALAAAGAGQSQEHGQHAHNHSSGGPVVPAEPGQGAFAAIAEIVELLRQSPATDWKAADIGALRAHLVDMDLLVTHASVAEEPLENGLRMLIGASGKGGEAASRMVPAHAPVLEAETGWSSVVEASGGQLVWTVLSEEDAAQIQALGFFGLMAAGNHHRSHHLAIATGQSSH